jgi:hypothetical protein
MKNNEPPETGEINEEIDLEVDLIMNNEETMNETSATNTNTENRRDRPILNRIQENMRTWAKNSSVHGLNRIFNDSDFNFKCFMWIIFYAVAMALCILSIVFTLNEYLERKVTTKIDVQYERELAFPTISFCNLNPFVTETGNVYIREFYSQKYAGIDFTNFTYKQLLHFRNESVSNSGYTWDMDDLFYKTFEHTFDMNRKRSFGLEFDTMFVETSFAGLSRELNANDFHWYYHPIYGNCFKFNVNSSGTCGGLWEQRIKAVIKENGFSSQVFMGKVDSNNDVLYKTVSRGLHIVLNDFNTFPIINKGIIIKVLVYNTHI